MFKLFRSNLVDLPTNVSLNYLWCSGFMLGSFLFVQVATGIILSFFFLSDVDRSFSFVNESANETLFLWVMRYCHIWGVTFIFFICFVHMGRALYYSSYRKISVWNVGFILYLLMMVEAFLGYILPWHQMSYWAATVITSVLQSIPIVGEAIYTYTVGGFSVNSDTLIRAFSAHVCLAFIILGVSVIHMFYLHLKGSNNPLFVGKGYGDVVLFHNYYTVKDAFVLMIMFVWFVVWVWVAPDFVLDIESYIEANPLETPDSIKPEWYFLAYYAMLRSVESKVGGMVLILMFLFLLWVPTLTSSCSFSVYRQGLFWSIVALFMLLSYLGTCHPEAPYVLVSKVTSGLMIIFMLLFKSTILVSWDKSTWSWLIRW